MTRWMRILAASLLALGSCERVDRSSRSGTAPTEEPQPSAHNPVPAPASGATLEGVVAIDAHPNGEFACALVDDGQVYCWGGLAEAYRCDVLQPGPHPRRVLGLFDATQIAVDEERAYARRANGEIVSWGRGAFARGYFRSAADGEIEIERAVHHDLARRWDNHCFADCSNTAVSTRVCTSDLYSPLCFATDAGVACDRSREFLGPRAPKLKVLRHPLTWNKDGQGMALQVRAVENNCILTTKGEVRCNAFSDDGVEPQLIELPGHATDLSFTMGDAGYRYVATLDDGRIFRWDIGERQTKPELIATIAGVKAVEFVRATGWGDICALDAKGQVWCWFDASPDDWVPTTCRTSRDGPALVPGLPRTTQLMGAWNLACALGVDQRVRCWGIAFGLGTLGPSDTDRSSANFICDPILVSSPQPGQDQAPPNPNDAAPTCAKLSSATEFVPWDQGAFLEYEPDEPEDPDLGAAAEPGPRLGRGKVRMRACPGTGPLYPLDL
ncbi:hypothetical protein ENSA5_55420 [Enhygromyxa salina]|uniref:Regulator of chromosome condensation (RCC1) repeat protein n=1 Tax=Enhygromyxa salina TaxID=215803 RepID=A0A2S9XEY6_9BACT|nr:hypothetical protein ENSA5_55420 [Enhygromyxa salina]